MFLTIAISHKRFLQSAPRELQYALWDLVASLCLRSFRLYGDHAFKVPLRVQQFFLFLETFCCSEKLCQFIWHSDKLERFYWTSKLSISSCFGDQLCSRPLKHGDPWKSGTKYGGGCVTSKEEGYQFCCIDNIRYS